MRKGTRSSCVTHDHAVADHAQRIIEIRDGEIVSDRENPHVKAGRGKLPQATRRRAGTGAPCATALSKRSTWPRSQWPRIACARSSRCWGIIIAASPRSCPSWGWVTARVRASSATSQRARHQHHRLVSGRGLRRYALGQGTDAETGDAIALSSQSYVDSGHAERADLGDRAIRERLGNHSGQRRERPVFSRARAEAGGRPRSSMPRQSVAWTRASSSIRTPASSSSASSARSPVGQVPAAGEGAVPRDRCDAEDERRVR